MATEIRGMSIGVTTRHGAPVNAKPGLLQQPYLNLPKHHPFGYWPGALNLSDFENKFRLVDRLNFLANKRITFLNSLRNWKVGAKSLHCF